ncbi:iron-containing alcohol dehydrogenase [Lentzea tibetensis]|uniref:iron-containing alcohol dehydrogenase n=1 Tax=Lentzea tibetensis TaxID=2591470 RepID=UPI0016446A2A|nr:iron-containing alcohol dehydrogenase [Lentzea tibetensis]
MNFFHLVPQVHYGPGSATRAGAALRDLGVRHVLVVTDQGVLDAGVIDPVLKSVKDAGIAFTVFSDLRTNPTEQHVAAAAYLYQSVGCDGILGVGGGSSLDVAKSAAVIIADGGRITSYEDGARAVTGTPPPLVQVPTTAGTGSEVVAGAIITDSSRMFKMHVVAVPAQVALCDPELTLTLPAGPTAASGIDALAHAIGAYTSSERQPLADAMAVHAIALIRRWLPDAVARGDDLRARDQMMTGALAAGISMKGGGAADHAFAHAVNALFDVHHGVGVALFLADAMEHNLPHMPDRFAVVARALGVRSATDDAIALGRAGIEVVRSLVADCPIPTLPAIGVTENDVPALVDKVQSDGFHLGLNPVPVTVDDTRRILHTALARS